MKIVGVFASTCLLVLLASGCSREADSSPIPREKFLQLYVDLLIAAELGQLSFPDSSNAPARSPAADSIFARHGVTVEQVDETVRAYSRDVRTWKGFYDEVIRRLETIQRDVGALSRDRNGSGFPSQLPR